MTTIPLVDEHRLVTLIQDRATTKRTWTARAGCVGRSVNPDAYFPEDDETPSTEALACCACCSVRLECLATALTHEATEEFRFGWWGGFGPDDREKLASRLDVPVHLEPASEPDDPVTLARQLRTQHYTVCAIASQLGCSERAVYRYLAASAA